MKVVFFCGGLGTRLRDYSSTIPKPMVAIGGKPILWHLMKYYAHFGHREFILCLGYKGEVIREYFTQDECYRHDQESGLIEVDDYQGEGWNITLVDTGMEANIGQRLKAVQYLIDDEVFLANYSDGLSDLPLDQHLKQFHQHNKVASFVSVRPASSFHAIDMNEEGLVADIRPARHAGFWINGGFFVFKRAIFDYIHDGEELVEAPFKRLIEAGELHSFRHDGFWACMDTPKDKINFDQFYQQQNKLWRVWL